MPGLPDELQDMPVRVAGIDTPEIRGQCDAEKKLARQDRDFVLGLLADAHHVRFCNPRRGKYLN